MAAMQSFRSHSRMKTTAQPGPERDVDEPGPGHEEEPAAHPEAAKQSAQSHSSMKTVDPPGPEREEDEPGPRHEEELAAPLSASEV